MAFDFPSTPSIGQVANGYVWDGEKWLSEGSPVPVVAVKKNYIINGAMQVSQENGTATGTANNYYPADQFYISQNMGANVSINQVASVTPGGSPNRIRYTIGTPADASVAIGDVVVIGHMIEGLRVADLLMGSASAKTITLAFGVKAPAGTFCVALRNSATNRNYVAEYVISSGEANTDVRKTVTIALDQSGTWLKDNGAGVCVTWALMCGTTYQGAANTWQAGNLLATSNQFNLCAATGNTFELFDVGLYEGLAPPFVVPDYASELALCQRYFVSETLGTCFFLSIEHTSAYRSLNIKFPVEMRSNPAVTGVFGVSASWLGGYPTIVDTSRWGFNARGDCTPATTAYSYISSYKANARL